MLRVWVPPRNKFFQYSVGRDERIRVICPNCGCNLGFKRAFNFICAYCHKTLPNLDSLINSADARVIWHYNAKGEVL